MVASLKGPKLHPDNKGKGRASFYMRSLWLITELFPVNSNSTRRKTHLSADDATCLTIKPQVPAFVPRGYHRDLPLGQGTQ